MSIITLHPLLVDSYPLGAWSVMGSNQQWYWGGNAINLQHAKIRWKAYMHAGTYSARYMTWTGPALGKTKFIIDGATIATWDVYSVGNVYNSTFATAGFVIAASGIKTIDLLTDDKNGASGGYWTLVTSLNLYMTAGAISSPTYCGYQNMHPQCYSSQPAGVWAVGNAISTLGYRTITNTSNASGDCVRYKTALSTGTYEVKILAETFANGGILEVYLGGVLVNTHDLYSVGGVGNVILTTAGINVATDGLKDLDLKINGKNGASGGFIAKIVRILVNRTA